MFLIRDSICILLKLIIYRRGDALGCPSDESLHVHRCITVTHPQTKSIPQVPQSLLRILEAGKTRVGHCSHEMTYLGGVRTDGQEGLHTKGSEATKVLTVLATHHLHHLRGEFEGGPLKLCPTRTNSQHESKI